jgi:hypothetical protein
LARHIERDLRIRGVREMGESEEIRRVLKAQIEIQCALNREIAKNVQKLIKLERIC